MDWIFATFLEKVINDGIAAAKKDYAAPSQASKLHGSVAGFEACRGKLPLELRALLTEATTSMEDYRREHQREPETYWFKLCYELEITWVCNVVSAMMYNQGFTPITEVTGRGLLKAAEILGWKRG